MKILVGAAPPTKNYVGAKIDKKLSKYIVIKGQKNFAATTTTKLSGVRFRGVSGKFSKYQFFRGTFDAAKTPFKALCVKIIGEKGKHQSCHPIEGLVGPCPLAPPPEAQVWGAISAKIW